MSKLKIDGKSYNSRLILGTGKYKDLDETKAAISISGAEMVTVAIRRMNIGQDINEPNLLDYIDTRDKRMNFERIFALVTSLEKPDLYLECSIFGIIHHYIHWGYNFEKYLQDYNENKLNDYKLIKVWTGR